MPQGACNKCKKKGSPGSNWIACEKESCKAKWYHTNCVGLGNVDKETLDIIKWYCVSCRTVSEVEHVTQPGNVEEMILSEIKKEIPVQVSEAVKAVLSDISKQIKELIKTEVTKQLSEITGIFNGKDRSFADALKEGIDSHSRPKVNAAELSREIKKQDQLQENRKLNLIVSGTKPDDEKDDKLIVSEVSEALNVSLEGVRVETKRIGQVRQDGSQLLRVKLNAEARHELLIKSRDLKNFQSFRCVYIQPDLTREQQQIQYELRQDLRAKRQSDPQKIWKISRGRVIEVKPTKQPNNNSGN